MKPTRLFASALFLAAVMTAGGLGFEATLLGRQAAAYQAGNMPEAAKLATRARLLRPKMAEQLNAQVAELARGTAADPLRELPLLEALTALRSEPTLEMRRDALRVLVADPSAMTFAEAGCTVGDLIVEETAKVVDPNPKAGAGPEASPDAAPPPGGGAATTAGRVAGVKTAQVDVPTPLFESEAIPDAGDDWGGNFTLTRHAPGGAAVPLGEGYAGVLGSSFEPSADGRGAVVARSGEHTIEWWDLEAGRCMTIATANEPRFVSTCPGSGPKRLAFSMASTGKGAEADGETVWLWEGGGRRQVFPGPGAPAIASLGFTWAPDGKSLLVRWPIMKAGAETPEATRIAWIASTGAVIGLTTDLDEPVTQVEPRWLPSPDGVTMGLAMGGGNWAWTAGDPEAVALEGVGGVWTWGPNGRLVVGVDDGQVFLSDPRRPGQRIARAVDGLPTFFEGDAGEIRWERDHLTIGGQARAAEDGQANAVTINARLALR